MIFDKFWLRFGIWHQTCTGWVEFVNMLDLYNHAINKTVCKTTIGLSVFKGWTSMWIRRW